MKKLRFLLLALVPALVLMLSACADDGTSSGSSSNGGDNVIPTPPPTVDLRCTDTYINNTIGYENTNDVWEIYNKHGLKNFSDNVTTNADINAKLVCDIELTNKADNTSWVPIGDAANRYNGTFDGDNYTISGLYINDNSSDYQGLFGSTNSSAVIKNLIVKNVEITANNYVSAIVGYNSGNVIYVHVDKVTINASSLVGTISGGNYGNIYASSVSNIDITATHDQARIGGIIGNNYDGNIVATYVENASITANGSDARLGGIVGNYENGKMVSSYTNDVTLIKTSIGASVGGIIGFDTNGDLSSNFFISGGSLNGVGEPASDIEAERITNIQVLNDNVTKMNNAIDKYNITANVAVSYKFIDNGANLPILQETETGTILYRIAISINDQYLQTGDTVDISAVLMPNNAIVDIIDWTNSNPSVATLDNGTITAIGNGDTTITASIAGTNIESKVIIRVEDVGLTIIGNTYEISNVSGLQAFRDATVNDNTTNGLLVDNITFIPLEYAHSSWIPIGDAVNQYNGTFNGDNYTISGLYIDNSSDYQGLFGASSGTVKDLIVKDVVITSESDVGVIVGFNSGSIINVHVVNVIIDAINFVGTITSRNYGNIYASSASNIDITATHNHARIGGIASVNVSDIVATYVDNATITANDADVAIGGIVAIYESGEIVSSYTNDVTIINTGASIPIGGIVGLHTNGTLSSNFFVSGNSLNGVGNNASNTASNTDAEPVINIQTLNNNVNDMNNGIDAYDTSFGFEYVPGDPDTDIPTLVPIK